jgi:ElaB/YqjD/DUF883 family membrane-anchored ribosome-binding protein
MSAPTDAHKETRRKIVCDLTPLEGAQLIADSEARACDQLRAEVERLTAQRENLFKPMRDQAIARAERAEAEIKDRAAMMREVMRERDAAEAKLATERARLDWLVKSSDNPLAINLFPSYGWTEVKKNLRASIDAAMKEGAK